MRAELPALPEVMARSAGRAGQYEAGIVSIVEAALLAPRVGDTFEAIVVDLNERRGGGVVAIREPRRSPATLASGSTCGSRRT